MRPAPLPKALCGLDVAWWGCAPPGAAPAPLPLAFGGTDMAGVEGQLWSLRATPGCAGKGKAEWQWDVAASVGGTAPPPRFACATPSLCPAFGPPVACESTRALTSTLPRSGGLRKTPVAAL